MLLCYGLLMGCLCALLIARLCCCLRSFAAIIRHRLLALLLAGFAACAAGACAVHDAVRPEANCAGAFMTMSQRLECQARSCVFQFGHILGCFEFCFIYLSDYCNLLPKKPEYRCAPRSRPTSTHIRAHAMNASAKMPIRPPAPPERCRARRRLNSQRHVRTSIRTHPSR